MSPTLVFNVNRRDPELVPPSEPTPHELKPLSDIDDQDGLRVQVPVIFVYTHSPSSIQKKDPVEVVRESLAKALVLFYPLAGRLREGAHRKLLVECTGEGALFVDADADVTLEEMGQLQPPFPCFEELLFDVPGSGRIVGCPLLHFQATIAQVTRLKCGGIIIAMRFNHAMCDGSGLYQFLTVMSELARGVRAPSITPVWMRHLLNARNPPQVTCTHREYEGLADTEKKLPFSKMTHRSFFFKLADISAIRGRLPAHLRRCSNFEVLTACLWKCRTTALQPDPEDIMQIICLVDARNKFNPPMPRGFYGNCIAYSTQIAKAGELCQKPIEFALELIRKAKNQVTEQYMRSTADLMVIKGRPWYTMVRAFLVSDVTRARFRELDFGWGNAAYAGPAKGHVASFHISSKNMEGEDGVTVTLCLPTPAMERFVMELGSWLQEQAEPVCPKSYRSAL